MSDGDWCLIESDPGVFTELIRGFGVQGLQVEELWSLDEESFQKLKPVYGLIFLYKWRPGEEPQGTIVRDSRLQDIFFARQVINNACATQAILSILLNISQPDIDLGTILTEFKEFAVPLDPANRGLALTNSMNMRNVHNSFSRQQMFEFDKDFSKKDEDTFHFVAYVPVGGRLYELDGLKEGPVDLGKCEHEDWLTAVKPIIDRRIQSYTTDEIHFNLLGIVADRKKLYEKQIEELTAKRDAAAQRIQAVLEGAEPMDDGSGMSSDPDQLVAVIDEMEGKIATVQTQVAEEVAKTEQYKLENIRRKHNYLPLIMEVLKILAKRGELVGLVEKAKKKKAEQKEKQKKETKEVK